LRQGAGNRTKIVNLLGILQFVRCQTL
jgi:hypothetical protein